MVRAALQLAPDVGGAGEQNGTTERRPYLMAQSREKRPDSSKESQDFTLSRQFLKLPSACAIRASRATACGNAGQEGIG